jgi:lysozyme family protein
MNDSDFSKAFAIVLDPQVEGGLSLDNRDAGNWTGGKVGEGTLKGTKYGISAASYPDEDIAGMTIERARTIYAMDYWVPMHCDLFLWPLNLVLFDTSVNMGVTSAIRIAQKEFGAAVDGKIGPRTINILKSVPTIGAAARLLRARSAYYKELPKWPIYGRGWVTRLFFIALSA